MPTYGELFLVPQLPCTEYFILPAFPYYELFFLPCLPCSVVYSAPLPFQWVVPSAHLSQGELFILLVFLTVTCSVCPAFLSVICYFLQSSPTSLFCAISLNRFAFLFLSWSSGCRWRITGPSSWASTTAATTSTPREHSGEAGGYSPKGTVSRDLRPLAFYTYLSKVPWLTSLNISNFEL